MAEPVRGVRHDVAWQVGGRATWVGSQALILVILAAVGSPLEVGRYALAVAIAGPVSPLFNLGLRHVLATDSARGTALSTYVAVRGLADAATLGFAVALVSLLPLDGEVAAVFLLVMIARTVDNHSDLLHGAFEQRGAMDWVGTSLILRAVGSVPLFWAGYVTLGLAPAAALLVAAPVAVLVLYDRPRFRQVVRDDPNPGLLGPGRHLAVVVSEARQSRWRPLLRASFPVGLAATVSSLHVNVPRYVVEVMAGTEALGVYALYAYVITAATMVGSSFGVAVTPRLARAHRAQDRSSFFGLLSRSVGSLALLGLVGVAVAAAVGIVAVQAVLGAPYADYPDVLIAAALIAAILAPAGIVSAALVAVRSFGVRLVAAVVAVVVTLPACIVLVQQFGVAGALYGFGVSIALRAVVEGRSVMTAWS